MVIMKMKESTPSKEFMREPIAERHTFIGTLNIKNMSQRQHKLFWGSSYDRGLQHLLKMWPKIREAFPDAELHVCYGWNLFDKAYANNPERQAWKERINKLMEQPGITHHGRVSKEKLREIESQCGIWAYPTDFQETCCITALDCQYVGCVPVTMALAGLKETVQSGVKIEGDIYDDETQEAWLKELLRLMGDEKEWDIEGGKGMLWAQQWSWENVARKWSDVIQA